MSETEELPTKPKRTYKPRTKKNIEIISPVENLTKGSIFTDIVPENSSSPKRASSDGPNPIGIESIKEDILPEEPSNEVVSTKKPRTEKQQQAFNRMREARLIKQKETKELKQLEKEKEKLDNETEKLSIKKEQLNKKMPKVNLTKGRILTDTNVDEPRIVNRVVRENTFSKGVAVNDIQPARQVSNDVKYIFV